MQNKHPLLAAAALAAFLSLAACNQQPETVSANDNDPQKEELAKAPPVTLPPPIRESKIYRCKDNSLVYVTYMADDVTAMVRDKQEEPPVATLKAPAKGEPFVSEGFKLAVNGKNITYNSPDKGQQSCKS
jgi:hypothetical protein